MSRRTATGAKTIATGGTRILGERKGEFDPVIHKDADPHSISDGTLKRKLCSMGTEKSCRTCRLCAYGREYVRRAEERRTAK